MRETGTGQQVAQLHERYDDDDDDNDLIQGSMIQQWVLQGPVTHLFHPVQCKL